MNTVSPVGSNWDDLEREIFTPEEIRAGNLRVAVIGELIRARQEAGISRKRPGNQA
ncbi:hypothetical protein [Neisseria bacilliformis]|uniref:hypothetical protein n=1 Tax=Neisseria bacilliformis TaxID=267212 RepID=UPI003C73EF7C